MEENKKELTPDPEELEVKFLLLRIVEIAKRKKIPVLCMAQLNTLGLNMAIGVGIPQSIIDLITDIMKNDIISNKIFIGAVAMHMLDKFNEDKSAPDADLNLAKYVQKNDPAGN